MKSLYSILGVSPDADAADIERAYAGHLDRLASSDDAQLAEQQRIRLIAIKEAYAVLADPLKRQLYNQKLFAPATLAAPILPAARAVSADSTAWVNKVKVVGALLVALLALYVYSSREQEKLRIQQELQQKAVHLAEEEQRRAAEEQEARLQRQEQLDAQARERQSKADWERLNREIDYRQRQSASLDEQKAQRERYERQQAEREADARQRRAISDARYQALRDKADLQRMERERYGKVITE